MHRQVEGLGFRVIPKWKGHIWQDSESSKTPAHVGTIIALLTCWNITMLGFCTSCLESAFVAA